MSSEYDAEYLLLDLFQRLRRNDFPLGIAELLAAYRIVQGGWECDDPDALRRAIDLLWCHSPQETMRFKEIFDVVFADCMRAAKPSIPQPERAEPPPPPREIPYDPPASTRPPVEEVSPSAELTALPVRSPYPTLSVDSGPELRAYWPVSRRSMVYTWRYLRRPVKEGPRDVLNVGATVERAARQGFFLGPVYNRRDVNNAHLLLMIDQGGSMTPFHRFTRDLVDTAREDSTIQQVDVVYFHNVPAASVFRDAYLTEPLPLLQALAGCTPDSSVLLVSDAGAARGYRSMSRIRATAEFLSELKRHTKFIAWLNPMPQPRWASTSAQFIARLVSMFQMDQDGLSNAVDILRGQPLHPRH